MMYHIRATFATTRRIFGQLSHDPRTVALIFVVPCLLMTLFRWLFSDNLAVFDRVAPALLGVFPFVIMFIITSITTLRERTGGTMERLMALPIGKFDLIMGYMMAFGLLAIIQALLVSVLILYGFNLDVTGPHWFLVAMALADALLGAALGLFVSAFAKTEFQAVQFMPALVFPQILIGGLFIPLSQMPSALESIAYYLPLTYAIDALNEVVSHMDVTDNAWRDMSVVGAFVVGALLLAAITLRRRNK
ncbi:MAG TPA: ABC transporter permease [Candidatus Saccharimonadales bacterium]|nr:ABC transporter permease [Candidatus Saccharimonadales bacterium]